MAEYRVEFTADSGSAERSIKNLKKEIKGVTKEFESAEIGAEGFIEAASNLSGLQKELKDARGAVVNIDKAYQDLNKALDSLGGAYDKANRAAESHHKKLLNLAQDSVSQEDKLRKKNFQAEVDDFDKRLKLATVSAKKMSAQQRAVMEFRAGMGARGAIPAVASPVRGGAAFPGSPAYLEAIAKAAKDAQQALNDAARTAGTIAPSPKAFHPASLAAFESKLKALRAEARLIAPDSSRWKELNKDILKSERSIERINKRQKLGPTAGQRAGAAGGAFLYGGGMGGGVGSAVGGIAGGLAGGVPGAFAGAAIGQVADNLGTALAGITSQAAAVQKMQRGLAMASVNAKDFAEAQAAVGEMSQKLLMPLEQTTKYFAQLRANTKEYNLSVADTKEILEGTALAIMATGGSAEDLDGAMRAVVQIMSKGGVQAEELRGQLGERFPGAVVKFAQANKLSFEDLQARLEAGTIGIREFINFAKKNYTDYAKFSEQLATAPEYAGQRLKMALEQISLEIGGLFGPMGADIQDLLTGTINNIAQFIKDNRAYLRQMISDFSSIVGPIAKVFVELMKVIANFSVQVGKIFQGLFAGIRQALGMASIGEARVRLEKAKAATAGKTRPTRNARGGGTTTSAEFIELEAAQRAFSGMGGQAAFDKANAPAQPSNLTFGGAGAGMSIDRAGKEDKEKKKKADSLESFERLRDQLANAYNQAEIERIKARYELQKRLQEDVYDMQEFGANRLQRENLQFLRALAKAEQDRQDTLMDAQLRVAEAAGKIAPSAPMLPAAGGSSSGLTSFTSQQLARATQDASRFTGVANMCSESVKAFYKSLGISLPGVTAWADTVRKAGQTMTDWSKLQAGDIVATGRPGDTPHVGVYTGGQNVFHQSKKRGLKAGNYPDLSYFQQQGYFVRPTASAGAPRKVGSNESRDTMAGANIDIAQQNAAFAARNALIAKGSAEAKAFAQYIQESFGLPDLRLSNDLLKMRNDLIAAGVSEEEITHRQRLFEINYKYDDLLKKYPGLVGLSIDIDGERVDALGFLKDALNEATMAERAKNDETLRGAYIQERKRIADALSMAKAVTPDQELRTSITQRGFTGEEADTLFQEEKALQGAEKLKADMQGIASGIGNAFGDAFKGVITDSMTAKEALGSFFKSVADMFLDMAAQIIAAWMKMIILNTIVKIFGGAAGGGGSAVPTDAGGWADSFGTLLPGLSGDIGRTPIGFAEGGFVSGPTMGLIGEGGESEYVIPASKMQSAMSRYSRGARGEGVIAGSGGGTEGGGGAAAAGPMVVDVRYSVERINDVEYVTASAFQAGMRQAAQQGAAQGEQRTLRRLQQSPGTRKRVGM